MDSPLGALEPERFAELRERGGTKWDPDKIGKPAERKAGWYDDPQRPDLQQLRYWNGSGWTDRTSSWLSAGGGRACAVLIGLAEGQVTTTGDEDGDTITTRLGANLGLFETCPGIDEPGNLGVLLGGNEGQIGSFLSGNNRITQITATIGPTLRIEPFTVETGYLRMTLQVD